MDIRQINDIVVVGGGTAGWLTALYAKSILPNVNITVIESEEIGILGAGEGTVPHFVDLLDFLEIPFSELVKNAQATMKNGIKFTNWKNDNTHYYHAFGLYSNIELGIQGCNLNPFSSSLLNALVTSSAREESSDDIEIFSNISEQNKVPLIKKENYNEKQNPILKYDSIGYWSIHFDASKVAKVLRSYAESRDIKRIEGVVESVLKNKEDEITTLILKNKKEINCQFVFDCTGFRREIIGKIYKSKWKSHKEKLPVDAAIPFFIPMEEKIPAYTESIAMKYGWMWKIPLQNRYGCGYVYDSSLVDEKQIIEEIEKYLGFEPNYPRKEKGGFSFDAGYYETPWVKNCIAVGLASGFIEPLEATSLWVTILQLKMVFSNSERLYIKNENICSHYNKTYTEISEQVVDFIYLHYMTGRDDTNFWKKFTYENSPENIKQLLDSWEFRLPEWDDYRKNIWSMHSWFEVGLGVGKINNKISKISEKHSETQKFASNKYNNVKTENLIITEKCADHREVLKDLINE